MSEACKKCGGSGLVPLPRGMSPGFYAFMAPRCVRRDDGTLLMNCECRASARRVTEIHRELDEYAGG